MSHIIKARSLDSYVFKSPFANGESDLWFFLTHPFSHFVLQLPLSEQLLHVPHSPAQGTSLDCIPVPSAWKEERVQVHPSTSCWQMLSRFQWWQIYIFQTVKCLAWHQIGEMLSTLYWDLDQPFGPVMPCSLDLWLLFSYWLAGTMFCSDHAVIESTKILP